MPHTLPQVISTSSHTYPSPPQSSFPVFLFQLHKSSSIEPVTLHFSPKWLKFHYAASIIGPQDLIQASPIFPCRCFRILASLSVFRSQDLSFSPGVGLRHFLLMIGGLRVLWLLLSFRFLDVEVGFLGRCSFLLNYRFASSASNEPLQTPTTTS